METNAFIITPHTERYQILHEKIFKPTLQSFGIRAKRAEELAFAGRISQKVSEAISGSDIIICDVSEFNANVFFEIGLARALNKNIITFCQEYAKIPSDFDGMRIIRYNMESLGWQRRLSNLLKEIIVQGGFSNRVYEFNEESPLDIYIKYKTLTLSEVTHFLINLNFLHESLLSLTSPIYYSQEGRIAFRNNLFVDRAYTGNSVNFSFKEGWLPEFNSENNDINIKVPKKLGIPALIGISLLTSANHILDVHNKYLDSQIKEIELKSKTIEYNQKVEESNKRSINLQSNKTIKELQKSKNIKYVEINNIPIIENRKP